MAKRKPLRETVPDSSSLSDKLLRLFTNHTGEFFKTNEVSKMIGIRSDDDRYQELRDLLRDFEDSGVISRGSRRRYGIPLTLPAKATGRIVMSRDGNAFVTADPNSGISKKVFIPKKELHGAKADDRVIIRIDPANIERPVGIVLEILESRFQTKLRPPRSKEAIVNDRAAKRPVKQLTLPASEAEHPARVFRERKDPVYKEEIEHLIGEYGLPGEFPEDVLKEVDTYSEKIPKEEIAKRADLRKMTIFTIDPEDAKDFDDAVSLVENEDWTLTLGVHIADVSHFVREGMALDGESLERGTSVYLAGGVIPMLPEKLSNDLCSLKPGVERLTYSVFMTIDPLTGKIKHSEFKKSVIKSVMRFSYEEAQLRIDSGRGKYAKLLRSMRELSEVLYAQRRKAGSIDFETDEVRFKFDENGVPVEALKKSRLGTMKMIEEFMLAANRTVAEFISLKAREGNEKPFLYRIHADPDRDKVREIATFAKTLGYAFNPDDITPKSIQRFLDSVKEKPEERLLNGLMLRAMAKAVYAEHNVGHFGLAFLHYTHFTSPIRRYPDLIIHRMLDEYLAHGGMVTRREHHYFQILPDIADHTSAMERRATEAERESSKIAALFVMLSHIGEEFDAMITGVQHFGFFVGLENGAEGLVHIRTLKGFYIYDEQHLVLTPQRGLSKLLPHQRKSKQQGSQSFRIGEKVRVKLLKVNFEKKGLDFVLAEDQGL